MSSASEKIRPQTNDCLELLTHITDTSNAADAQQAWAEEQRARLRLWARSLGVFASDRRLSVQHRLQDNTVVAKVIYQQLRSLQRSLTAYLEQILSGPESNHGDHVSGEEDSDTSVSSSSSSDGQRLPRARITDIQGRIDDTIGRLTRLSASIRRDGALQRKQKAISFVPKEHGVSLVAEFSSYVDEVCHRELPLHESPTEGQFVVASHLRERVKLTMMQRWRRISYVNHHADKFGGVTVDGNGKEQVALRQLPAFLPSAEEIQNRAGMADRVAQDPSMKIHARPATVNTDATVLRREFKIAPELLERPLSQAATSVVTKTGDGDFPRPPKTRPGQKEFECPYCRQLLSVKESRSKRWRAHVTSDLAPYFCLFGECGNYNNNIIKGEDGESQEIHIQVFRTSEEWLAHMRQKHSRPAWNCSQCTSLTRKEAARSFQSTEEIREHLNVEHETHLSDAQANILLQTSSGWEPLLFAQCSFCGFQPDISAHNGDFKEDSFQNEIIDHMQKAHMLAFALMSLPWHISGGVDEGNSNTAIQTGTTGESSNQGKMELLKDPRLLEDLTHLDDIAPKFGHGRTATFSELRRLLPPITNAMLTGTIEEWITIEAPEEVDASISQPVNQDEDVQGDSLESVTELDEHESYSQSQAEEERGMNEYWNEMSVELYEWLQPHESNVDHVLARSHHQPGTGSWVLDREDYKGWKSERKNCLWLRGPLGCGKTILCSTIIADLLESNQSSSENVFFFYFNWKDPRRKCYLDFVRSFLWGFVQRDFLCRHHLHLIRQRSTGRGEIQFGLDDGLEALGEMLRVSGGSIRVVLDSVDDCDERHTLPMYLEILHSYGVPVLLTSRNTMRFGEAMPYNPEVVDIELEKRFVEADIQKVVENTFSKDDGFSWLDHNTDVSSSFQRMIVERADGMFLWVKYQLKALRKCRTVTSLRQQLQNVPSILEVEYEHLLRVSTPQDLIILLCILGFAVFLEPLTPEEAEDMLRCNKTLQIPPDFILDDLVQQFSDVMCKTFSSLDDGVVQTRLDVRHWTLKTYLTSHNFWATSEPAWFLPFDVEHTLVACIDHLISGAEDHHPFAVYKPGSSFALYAARNCMLLASEVEQDVPSTREKISSLLLSPNVYFFWLSLFNPDLDIPSQYEDRLPIQRDDQIPPLYCASLHGLYHTVETSLERGADPNVKGGWYGTALHAAAARGNLAVVRLLLQKGADVNFMGGLYGTALQAAAGSVINPKGQQLEVVAELLNSGADADANGGIYGTALQAASAEGHDEIVEVLMAHPCDINSVGGHFGTALQAACADGHIDIVRRLLNLEGIDIDIVAGVYGTALQAACVGGFESIVQMLLDNHADTGIIAGPAGSALMAACGLTYTEVLRRLLDHGAAATLQNPAGQAAIQFCAANGKYEMVRILIDNGATIDVLDDTTGSTPLHYAAANARRSVTLLLLSANVNINACDRTKGRTPLHYAAQRGHLEMVTLLMDHGAEPSIPDVNGLTAAELASSNEYTEIASLISESVDSDRSVTPKPTAHPDYHYDYDAEKWAIRDENRKFWRDHKYEQWE